MGCQSSSPAQELDTTLWAWYPLSISYEEKEMGQYVQCDISFGENGSLARIDAKKRRGSEATSSLLPGLSSTSSVAAPAGVPMDPEAERMQRAILASLQEEPPAPSANTGLLSDQAHAPNSSNVGPVYPVHGAWLGFGDKNMACIECYGTTYISTLGQYAVTKPYWIKLSDTMGKVILTVQQNVYSQEMRAYIGDAKTHNKEPPDNCLLITSAKCLSAMKKPVQWKGELRLSPVLADPGLDEDKAIIRSLSLLIAGLCIGNLNRMG